MGSFIRYIPCGLVLIAAFSGLPADAGTTVTFPRSTSVDLGSNLDKLATLDRWEYTLGTEWDERFTLGGIIGAPNTTIIPEIKILGKSTPSRGPFEPPASPHTGDQGHWRAMREPLGQRMNNLTRQHLHKVV